MEEGFLQYILPESEWPSLAKREANSSSLVITSERWNTSLLFQCAVACCEQRRSVVFVTTEPFQSVPMAVRGMPTPSKRNMAFLHFAYVKDSASLVRFLAKFHMEFYDVELLIVDKLDIYMDGIQQGPDSSERKRAFLLALLQDAATLSTSSGEGHRLRLAVSCNPSSSTAGFLGFFDRAIVVTPDGDDYVMKILPFEFDNASKVTFHECHDGTLHVCHGRCPLVVRTI